MPELPEVETTCRGIAPHVIGQTIGNVTIRNRNLRWPITRGFKGHVEGRQVKSVSRRGKYLLLELDDATHILIHLGMSGRLCIVAAKEAAAKHDHLDIQFSQQVILRYTDPRRFGTVQWYKGAVETHSLLQHLGPEPLSQEFTGDYLYKEIHHRKAPIKNLIMDSRRVVGVGNIYASEALFLSGIHPQRPGASLDQLECQRLSKMIKKVLKAAIKQGGTTLKDFVGSDGQAGYFQVALNVYGRSGESCFICKEPLKSGFIGQRNTFWCDQCQN